MKHYSYLAISNSVRYVLRRYGLEKPDVIWLASYPRSGNTFYRALLKYVYDMPSVDFHRLRRPYRGSDVGEAMGLTTGPLRRNPATGRKLLFVKTHTMSPKDDNPGIYIVRDGRDALVSHAYFRLNGSLRLPAEERTREKFVETLRTVLDKNSYGGWSANVEAWTRKSSTRLVKFEDLIQTPLETLRDSLMGVGCPVSELETGTLPTFAELQKQHPNFFHQGRVGAWRDEMPDDIHRLFWERHGETMIKMGYTDGMP